MENMRSLVNASLGFIMPISTNSSLSGRLWLASMGLFIAAAGLVFMWVLWTAWQRSEETRRWLPLPCQIISSRVSQERPTPSSNPAYRAVVKYRYTFQNQEMTGTRIKRVDIPSQHEEVVRQKLSPYPVGKELTCYVNPAQPDQAVLLHDTRAALYSIWFPGLFVVGGLGMFWSACRRRK